LLVSIVDDWCHILHVPTELVFPFFKHRCGWSSDNSVFLGWLRIKVVLSEERLWDCAINIAGGFAEDVIAAQMTYVQLNFFIVLRQNLAQISLVDRVKNHKGWRVGWH
jgi:hypothetical protein